MRILNCVPSDGIENDWTYEKAIKVNFITENHPVREVVDLRENNEWWEINDQEKTGSCVGWAIADSCLRWHLVQKNSLPKGMLLSTRFVWMASKEIDGIKRPTSFIEYAPTRIKAGLDVIKDYGCVTEELLPFDKNAKAKNLDEIEFYLSASEFRIQNYINLIKQNEDKILVWKKWLSNDRGPIVVRLEIDKTWNSISDRNPYLENYLTATAVGGGHAVAIVGYDKYGFIVRNSWGQSWGHNGYAYASFDYANEAFTEAYGICI